MIRSPIAPLLAALALSPAALAHQGVEDPQVMARMEAMKAIGQATETLGEMAKGEAAFDAAAARAARERLVAEARRVPALFEPPASDPQSEARPAIWQDWPDFVDRAERLEAAAADLDPGSLAGLRADFPALGRACSGCHEDYRIEK